MLLVKTEKRRDRSAKSIALAAGDGLVEPKVGDTKLVGIPEEKGRVTAGRDGSGKGQEVEKKRGCGDHCSWRVGEILGMGVVMEGSCWRLVIVGSG